MTTYFGSTLYQYILYFAVLSIGVIIGQILNYFYRYYLRKKAKSTKNRLDDIILKTLGKPVMFLGLVLAAILGRPLISPTQTLSILLDNAINISVIISAAWVSLRFAEGIIETYLSGYAETSESKLDDQLVPIIHKIFNVTIAILTLIVILDSVGYNVTAIIASLGIGGIAVAFAARKTIADMFGGFNILTARPFIVDDRIKIKDIDGHVEEIGLRYTRIRDLDGRLVTIPNSTVASSEIENISSEPTRRVTMMIGLVYSTTPKQMQKAIETTKKTINSTKGITKQKTEIQFWEYTDSAMTLRVIYHIKDLSSHRNIRSKVNQKIQKIYEENDFEMAYPTREIHLKQDEKITENKIS